MGHFIAGAEGEEREWNDLRGHERRTGKWQIAILALHNGFICLLITADINDVNHEYYQHKQENSTTPSINQSKQICIVPCVASVILIYVT